MHFQRFLPWHGECLLLNKGMLDMLRLRCLRKNRAIVDSAVAQLRHFCFVMVLRRWIRRKREVFNVEHGDPVGVIFHNLSWIYARDYGPSTFELEGDLLWISELQQLHIWCLAVTHDKLACVVVIAKADVRGSRLLSESVELLCVVAPIVERVWLWAAGCSSWR